MTRDADIARAEECIDFLLEFVFGTRVATDDEVDRAIPELDELLPDAD
jgi:hypothetical protein